MIKSLKKILFYEKSVENLKSAIVADANLQVKF
jgi:hypothetical protein